MAEGNRWTKRKRPPPDKGERRTSASRYHLASSAPNGDQPQRTPTRPDSVTGVPGDDYYAHAGGSPTRLTRELPTSPPQARTNRLLSVRGSHRTILVQCLTICYFSLQNTTPQLSLASFLYDSLLPIVPKVLGLLPSFSWLICRDCMPASGFTFYRADDILI